MFRRIGIVGGSGSGKSTLALALQKHWGAERVTSLCLDDYYRDLAYLSSEEREGWDFDRPAALELARFYQDVEQLARGQEVFVPVYDFKTHGRVGRRLVRPAPFICAEGLFLWTEPQTASRWDYRIFVHTPEAVRLARRLGRDTASRGRREAEERLRFRTKVAPAHVRYVEPQAQQAQMVLRGEEVVETWVAQILARFPELA
jgi:uridine kinase